MGRSSDLKSNLQTSKLLQDFLENHSEARVYLRDIINEFSDTSKQGARICAFAPILLICALPEALPLPIAGVSAIIDIPLIFISAQFLLGLSKPWLPSWIINRSLKREDFVKIINQVIRVLHKTEYLIRPRWYFFTSPASQRI